MKSKRALKKLTNRKLVETSEGKRWTCDLDIAFQAVELAEQDARERAANAFCAICCDPCNASKEDQELCAGCYSDLAKFLKVYGDE